MPHYERPPEEVEPLTFTVRNVTLTAPGEAPFGTLELMAPAAGDGPTAAKIGLIPIVLRHAFGDQLDSVVGMTENDGMWLFQRLNEGWFGTPTQPSSPSSGGGGNTGSASTPNSSAAASTQPVMSTLGAGSPLRSPQ